MDDNSKNSKRVLKWFIRFVVVVIIIYLGILTYTTVYLPSTLSL